MEAVLFILTFLFVFGVLVFVHELGHFLAAKFSKVEVKEFGFGFPPAIFKKKFRETTYSINLIPLGGFIKMLGEDGSEENNPRSFSSQRKLTKALIISAGVLMNFFLACFIFVFLYAVGFQSLIPDTEKHIGVQKKILVDEVQGNTPAFEKGLQKNDEILKIDSEEVKSTQDLRLIFKDRVEKDTNMKIRRNGQEQDIRIVPFKDLIGSEVIGRIGIATREEVKADNIYFAFRAGFAESFNLAGLTIKGIGGFFNNIFTKFNLGEEVVGPIGIAVMTDQIRVLGFAILLQFIAALSISLAFFNILPIPPFDGYHLLITAIEKVRGKELSVSVKNILTIAGLIFLGILMIVITFKDLERFDIINQLKRLFGA